MKLAAAVHDRFFGGVLDKAREKDGWSWGGPECREVGERWASKSQRQIESAFWLLFAAAVYYAIDVPKVFKWMHDVSTKELETQARSKAAAKGFWQMTYERVLAAVHFVLFGMLIYWKYIDRVSVLLTQPCHLIVLLQGVALLSTTSLGPLITVLQMTTLFGGLLAMIVPATAGLSAMEVTCYWLEHVLIQVGPIYLLSRQNFVALKVCNVKSILLGVWVCLVAHWTYYDWMDHLFNVNVDFMLCPTVGMLEIFRLLPPVLSLPSWASSICLFTMLFGFLLSYCYVWCARGIAALSKALVGGKRGKGK